MNATATLAMNYAWIRYNNTARRFNKKFNREEFAAILANAYDVIRKFGPHSPSYIRHTVEDAMKRMVRK